MSNPRALVLQRHRHLKWPAFDVLEAALMVLCGACIFMFTLAVGCDVVTRTIGRPWLWLQQVTTAFFAWGVFFGMAAATRRNDHFYLTEITKRMTGASRSMIEIANRLVVLAVALLLALLSLAAAARPPAPLAGRVPLGLAGAAATLVAGLMLWQADAYTARMWPAVYGGRVWQMEASFRSLFGTVKILRSAPEDDGPTSMWALRFEDELLPDWPNVLARVLRAERIGPVIEIYRVP